VRSGATPVNHVSDDGEEAHPDHAPAGPDSLTLGRLAAELQAVDPPHTPYRPGRTAALAMATRDTIWLTLMFLTPLLTYGGNLGFSVLMALAGLASLAVVPPARRRSVGFGLLLALLLVALASEAWAVWKPDLTRLDKARNVQGLTGMKLVFQLALYGSAAAAMVAVRRSAASLGLTVLGVGLALVLAVDLIEFVGSERIYLSIKVALHQVARPDLAKRNIARAFYPLALFVWPVGLHLWRQGGRWRVLSMALLGGTLAGSVAFRVDSPFLALLVSGLVVAAVLRFGRAAVIGAMGASIVYVLLAPLVLGRHGLVAGLNLDHGVAKASWGARLEIWKFTASLIEQRPFLGWGLDASRAFPGAIPLHPHDAALQMWLELGAVGAALMATLFAWLFVQIDTVRMRDPALAAAAAGSLCAYLLIGALSFGAWQEWWLALGALTVVLFRALANARRLPRPDRSFGLVELTPL
jgi:O-antigen ligase